MYIIIKLIHNLITAPFYALKTTILHRHVISIKYNYQNFEFFIPRIQKLLCIVTPKETLAFQKFCSDFQDYANHIPCFSRIVLFSSKGKSLFGWNFAKFFLCNLCFYVLYPLYEFYWILYSVFWPRVYHKNVTILRKCCKIRVFFSQYQ